MANYCSFTFIIHFLYTLQTIIEEHTQINELEVEHLIIDGQVDGLTDDLITESMFVTTNENGDVIETTANDIANVQMIKVGRNKKSVAKRSKV